MANALFQTFGAGLLDGSIVPTVDTIKVVALELTVADVGVKQITAASNATPIVVTSAAHGFTNGDIVSISAVLGNTAANGIRKVKNVATNTYELTDLSDVNIAGNGAYTSGGRAVNLTLADNLDDIDACVVGTATTLASKTNTGGAFDSADPTLTAVTTGHNVHAIGMYKDTGTPSTSRLIGIWDEGTAGQGLPIPTNGGNLLITVAALGWFDLV